ncbi:kinesin-like protein KIF20B isoform X2 [Alosa sapidissima]|uniref:kinesin-like protein KIF20B isoform X2 n=1 Tax=Alosa sapidissima TaxID=34773 RepID=UPI001C094E63|nr:kinesin-like protein KIF20B isoform X2 [Alosa sapidissima]
MDTCMNTKMERLESEDVADLRKDLLSEFSVMSDGQNSTTEAKEHLKVYLRIRPFTSFETENGESQDCVAIETPDTVLLKAPTMSLSSRLSDKSASQTAQRFQFSQVYGPDTTQKEMFDGTVKTLVKDVLEGGNSLVFTYGVTNAGKTYTFLGPETNAGILPRSLNVIFSSIEGHIYTQMNLKPQRCREFIRLAADQQSEEATMKRSLFRLLKESDARNTSSQSNSRINPEGSTLSELDGSLMEDGFNLDLEEHTKFSVWVSFCEIYNENIHDLLEPVPTGAARRPALRLSQDVKGNLFVKDLRWVQVNSAEEAYKIMKVGKKNQSFSSTKLNQLSSRSHSIFSIRVMRIDDVGLPRVKTVSELSLCDLAGSERCAKTQNVGDRLKEAGNINTSLLTLGKCINILRHNQQAKVPQLVPFRESKLTHYLQSYFMGRGKACMIVNVNQCASVYDETLNVLKFSAVAQKVVVLSTKTIPVVEVGKKGARKVSFIINNAEHRNLERKLRRSSLVQWDSSLEDVQEDEDDWEEEEDDSVTDLVEPYEEQLRLVEELKEELQKVKSDNMLVECRIREEVTNDFSELFTQMEADFSERLAKEKAMIEERCERRLELLKELVKKNSRHDEDEDGVQSNDEQCLDEMIDSMCSDVESIRKDAEAAQSCLVSHPAPAPAPIAMLSDLQRKVTELTQELIQSQSLLSKKTSELDKQQKQSREELEETKKKLQSQEVRCEEQMAMCHQKDSMVSKLQATIDMQTEATTKDRALIDSIRKELLELRAKCTCTGAGGRSSQTETRKRRQQQGEGLDEQPPLKKGAVDDCDLSELSDPSEVKGQPEVTQAESQLKGERLAESEQRRQSLELRLRDVAAQLTDRQRAHDQVLREKEELDREVNILQSKSREQVRTLAELEAEVSTTKAQLQATQGQDAEELERTCKELSAAKAQMATQEAEVREKTALIEKLSQEVQQLRGKVAAVTTDSSHLDDKVKQRQEMDDKEASLSSKDKELCQREKELSEREAELKVLQEQCRAPGHDRHAELEKALGLREATLSQKEQELEEKLATTEAQLAEKEEALEEKLAMKSAEHSQREEARERRLALREAELSQREEALERKLADQEAELEKRTALREAEFLQKDEELRSTLTAKEEELSKREGEVEKAQAHQEAVATQSKSEASSSSSQKELASREAELASKEALLSQKEEELSRLQRSLKEAQERAEEAESAAVQEARRKEVERRRELLAVAEEAIAQKDGELQKRAQEINRLKEELKVGTDKVQSLALDLQRREDDSSDLKEKLVDSKKQIQQVQKEISSMRDVEKSLRQKVQDLEKTRAQLQKDLSSRDRAIHMLKSEQSADKSDETLQLYQKACKDLQAREQVIEDMRMVLTEQEETQNQMDLELEAQLDQNQQLTQEVEKLKTLLLKQDSRRDVGMTGEMDTQAREELAQAQENLKLSSEKSQADRKKWLDEKMVLIRQAKEAEEKRNQEMRRFADERERHARQQTELEAMSERLRERDQEMERWRKDRDTLVSALEVQLRKLVASNMEKDQQLQRLQRSNDSQPLEGEASVEQLRKLLSDREAEILHLKDQLRTSTQPGHSNPAPPPPQRDSSTQTNLVAEPEKVSDISTGKLLDSSTLRQQREKSRGSVISQSSSGGYPSVLESSEISTETGRRSRFPRPELEISFSPLQPDRLALRRQGDDEAVTVKIKRSARKRKSTDIEKSFSLRKKIGKSNNKATPQTPKQNTQDAVDSENKRNTRSRLTPKLAMHQEESPAPSSKASHGSQSSLRSGREGKLQKIGDFLQSSPTFLGSKAKKIMGLVSGRSDVDGGTSSKRPKKKLYHPAISAPMDIPANQIIGRETEERESDHLVIKRRLRSRFGK